MPAIVNLPAPAARPAAALRATGATRQPKSSKSRFRKSESPAESVRRILLEELDYARDELTVAGHDAGALHEVRKRLKKLRALLDLARPALGRVAAGENRAMRDAARTLASHRTTDALRAVLEAEARAAGAEDREALLAAVRLHQHIDRQPTNRGRDVENVRRVLGALRRRLAASRIEDLPRGSYRRRFRKSYKRARRAYRLARENPTPAALHEWRKRVKHLLNQARFLRGWGGTALGELRGRLVEIDDRLGRGRDCEFLALILRGMPAAEAPLRYGQGLRARLETIARDETARALQIGSRLFRRRSRAFAEKMLG